MSGRSTVYNAGLTANYDQVSKENKDIFQEFLDYLKATNHSPQTCHQYEAQIKIFLCWLAKLNSAKHFTEVKKRELIKFFGALQNDYGMSPNRIATIKSCLSSFSKFISNIMEDEFPHYKPIVGDIPIAAKENVRPKSVFTEEQMSELLYELTDKKKYELACFLGILMASGCRKAEAIQMQVDFFTDKNLVLHDQFWKTPLIRCKGKGVKGKQLQKYCIVDIFKEPLENWLKERETKGIKSPYLFTVFKNGNYVPAKISTANSWGEQISKIAEAKFGIPFFPHCARHWACSYLMAQGLKEATVVQLFGWAKGSGGAMVAIYNDVSDDEELEKEFAERGVKNILLDKKD